MRIRRRDGSDPGTFIGTVMARNDRVEPCFFAINHCTSENGKARCGSFQLSSGNEGKLRQSLELSVVSTPTWILPSNRGSVPGLSNDLAFSEMLLEETGDRDHHSEWTDSGSPMVQMSFLDFVYFKGSRGPTGADIIQSFGGDGARTFCNLRQIPNALVLSIRSTIGRNIAKMKR